MIQVAGVDIDGLVIVTGSGGTVRGQVASDDGTPVPGLDRLVVRRATADVGGTVVDARLRRATVA